MKKIILCAATVLLTVMAKAAETNSVADAAEAKYTAAIESRTAAILTILNLSDTNQAVKVHDTIIAQYRSLNTWHDANDAKLKAVKTDTNAVAQIRATLKTLHNEFLTRLAENLTPEQIEQVKDKMTYGKVQFTFKGYTLEYPNMTDEQKAEVLRLLKEAREEAMDAGSADEKSAVFNRYKGKINNYLSKQGVHPARAKAKPAPPATNSVPQP
jgi:Spy/CpxP family protein refolding chaperone